MRGISEKDSKDIMHGTRPADLVCFNELPQIGRFGKAEVEIAAGKLIKFFQKLGFWKIIDIKELIVFYDEQGWDHRDMLFGLSGAWIDDGGFGSLVPDHGELIIRGSDGCYCITDLFIQTCAKK